jgi:hypothetical protein
MRKLFTGILLAAALPAFASITSDVNEGIKTADTIGSEAIAACEGGATCQELAIEEALTAGLDLNSVISVAMASGVKADIANNAAISAGHNSADISNAIVSAALALDPTASGETITGFDTTLTIDAITPPQLTTFTGVSQAN